jgi:hypothetical protein
MAAYKCISSSLPFLGVFPGPLVTCDWIPIFIMTNPPWRLAPFMYVVVHTSPQVYPAGAPLLDAVADATSRRRRLHRICGSVWGSDAAAIARGEWPGMPSLGRRRPAQPVDLACAAFERRAGRLFSARCVGRGPGTQPNPQPRSEGPGGACRG